MMSQPMSHTLRGSRATAMDARQPDELSARQARLNRIAAQISVPADRLGRIAMLLSNPVDIAADHGTTGQHE